MKKPILVFAVMMIFGILLNAQVRSAHYEVIVSGGNAGIYSSELEQRFAVYNSIFRFDPALLVSPLRVRVFTDKDEYDSYVGSRLGNPRPGAVYLHYRSPENRELVILEGSEEERRLIPHQAFIQFLRAFIPDPPAWIREGFAVYFNTLEFDRASDALVYEENLIWLETAKSLTVDPETVFLADSSFTETSQASAAGSGFHAASWSLVSFFMADKNSEYYRALTDSFMVLSPGATVEENSRAMYRRLTLFSPIDVLTGNYNAFIAGKKTFAELVEEGQKAYDAGNSAAAEDFFRRAAELRSSHHIPCYYLGLLAYGDKKYNEAEEFYLMALNNGAERALIQYARGVNAAAAGRRSEALVFLEEASAEERYKARSDELIRRLR